MGRRCFKILISLLCTLIILLLAILCYFTLWRIELGPILHTKAGSIQSRVSRSRDGREYHSWLQIPYAQPPLGQLRFSSPQPFEKWEGVRDGTEMGSACPQTFFGFTIGSEDCLFLNVHVPKSAPKPLPVHVFIHGGAFVVGSSHMANPEYFMDDDTVFVSLNYRLGVLGFFTTGDKNIRGNMGLKDQTMALKWVKENVDDFGGDPERIMISGQSAGGSSVHFQVLSPTTKGLFNKAISMSGSALLPWAFTSTEGAIDETRKYAGKLDCPLDDNEKLVECLRSMDVVDLLGAMGSDHWQEYFLMNPSKAGFLFGPTVEVVEDEESFLTQGPYDVLRQGMAQPVPWMSGVTRDEGLLASFGFYRDDEAMDYFENNWEKCLQNSIKLQPRLSPEEASETSQRIREFYFPNNQKLDRETRISRYTEMFSDALFLTGASQAAAIQKDFAPVYLYFYNKTTMTSLMSHWAGIKTRFHPLVEAVIYGGKYLWNQVIMGQPTRDYGVFHAADGLMLFPMYSFVHIARDDKDYQFSKDMVKLFTDFLKSDDKNISLEFRGVEFESLKKEGPLMYLETNNVARMIEEPFANRTAFWESIQFAQLFSSIKNK